MDLKILKQDISTNCEVFNQSAEHSIDTELSIPDYCPKISRILKCKVMPLAGAHINGSVINVEGNVNICLIYITDTGTISSYEYILPLSRSFEADKDLAGSVANCKLKEEYINCRLLGENKVELHGAIGISVTAEKKQCNKVVSDASGAGVMLNLGSAPATTPIGVTEKFLTVEEQLELLDGQPSITNILRYDITPVNTDCKIISGKAAVKGELRVFVLYCAAGVGTPQALKTTVPYSQILDIEGLGEDCECSCKTNLVSCSVTPRTSITGEIRTVSLTAKLRFCAEACCNNDVSVVYDAFSTKYDTHLEKQDIIFKKIVKTMHNNTVCRKKIELGSGTVGNIIDLWSTPEVNSCKAEGGEVNLGGVMKVGVLAFDNENQPTYYEKSLDFDYTCMIDDKSERLFCSADAAPQKISYTILNPNCIEITVELLINITIYKEYSLPVVEDITVDEQAVKQNKGDTALIIYYADAGEKIWDIARKYNSSPIEIAEINTVEEAELPCAKTLLIPVK